MFDVGKVSGRSGRLIDSVGGGALTVVACPLFPLMLDMFRPRLAMGRIMPHNTGACQSRFRPQYRPIRNWPIAAQADDVEGG
jgi:hypothetical protein